MTLKPIETEFSERLLRQNKMDESRLDLSEKAPLVTIVPPKVIWAQLQFEHDPSREVSRLEIPGWFYDCFKDLKSAELKYPQIHTKLTGTPTNVYKFLQSEAAQGIIDFSPLGVAVVSKEALNIETTQELHQHTMPYWLHYALSPELWGPQGKWTRFHSRLHTLLQGKGLLAGTDFPGFYPLPKQAKKLESFGFFGSDLENSYLLVLPWSFPLTALEKLETTIQQEF